MMTDSKNDTIDKYLKNNIWHLVSIFSQKKYTVSAITLQISFSRPERHISHDTYHIWCIICDIWYITYESYDMTLHPITGFLLILNGPQK